MKLSDKYMSDLHEAFSFWREQQLLNPKSAVTKEQLDNVSLDQWIAGLLQQPIYSLLAQKRTADATKTSK